MTTLWLVAAGIVLAWVGALLFSTLARRQWSEFGTRELRLNMWTFLRIVPRFGSRRHYTERGWLYRQLFVACWVAFVVLGVLIVLMLPAHMNGS